jgi:hypothetical protein
MRVGGKSSGVCAGAMAICALMLYLAIPADSHSVASSFCNTEDLRRVEARATGPRTQDVALAMKSEVLLPGALASARLLNRGQSRAGYGLAFRIERLVEGQWTLDPASPTGPWPKKLGRLDPGGLSTCYRFPVPSDQPTGQYRFTVSVQLRQGAAHRSALFRIR